MVSPTLPSVAERAFERLAFSEMPSTDLDGLRRLYRAWGLSVPFDNVRKMIALQTDAPGPLPGGTAEDFLGAWLQHGAGGTCWPNNNAFYALLRAAGFDAYRMTGSMWDLGIDNHGTTLVRLDEQDWLVDGAQWTGEPLPLVQGQVHQATDPVYCAEIDPEGDDFYLWAPHPPLPHLLLCRLLERDVPESLYLSNYERSREMSPFNAKLYARRNFEDEMRVLAGNRLVTLTASGQTVTVLSEGELLAEMKGPFGYSEELVDRWAVSGALAATMAQTEPPPKPPLNRVPPSQR